MKIFFSICALLAFSHVFAQTDTIRYRNGKIKSITNGEGDTKEFTNYYENGKISGQRYIKKNIAYLVSYYEDGVKASQLSYKNGKWHGHNLSWFPNGKPHEQKMYDEGLQTGKSVRWKDDGVMLEEFNFTIIEEKDKKGKRKSVKNGKYISNYNNGKPRAKGNYKLDKRDGKWEEWYEDGKQRELSHWKNNLRAGEYNYWDKDGKKTFEGNYVLIDNTHGDKVSVGDGKFMTYNGTIQEEGEYIKGKKTGLWLEWYNDGKKKSEKEFKNGYINGKNIEWYKNGNLNREEYYLSKLDTSGRYVKEYWHYGKYIQNYEDGKPKDVGSYKEGKKDGLWTSYNSSGQKKSEATYIGGLISGELTYWNDNGNITSKLNHIIVEDANKVKKNERHGASLYYESNGTLISEVNYVHDNAEGIWKRWYPDGKIQEVSFYHLNVKAGADTSWYQNGKLKEVGTYAVKEGKKENASQREGQFIYYFENGNISRRTSFSKDLSYRAEQFYENGNLKLDQYSFIMGDYSMQEGFIYEYYSNGQVKEEIYITESFHYGREMQWYMNGKLKALIDFDRRADRGKVETAWFSDGSFASIEDYDYVNRKTTPLSKSIADSLYTLTNKRKSTQGKTENGLKQGKWLTWYDDKHVQYEMNFVNGELQGLFTSYFPDGKKMSEFQLQKNLAEGNFSLWYPNGKLKTEGNYKNNKPAGHWVKYQNNGNKLDEYEFDSTLAGHYIYKKEWYGNGNMKEEYQYLNGAMVIHKNWNENGKLYNEFFQINGESNYYYDNGVLHTKSKQLGKGKSLYYSYFENGKMSFEQYQLNNKSDSIFRRWDENGNQLVEGYFKDGAKDGLWKYYEKGVVKRTETYHDGDLEIPPSPLDCNCRRYKKHGYIYIPALDGLASWEEVKNQSFPYVDSIGEIYNSLFYSRHYGGDANNYSFTIVAFEEVAVRIPDSKGVKLILNPCDVGNSETEIPFNGKFYEYDKTRTEITLDPGRIALEFSPLLIRQWDKEKNLPFYDEEKQSIPSKLFFDVNEIEANYTEISLEGVNKICFPYSEITNTGVFLDFNHMVPDLNINSFIPMERELNHDFPYKKEFVGVYIDTADVFVNWIDPGTKASAVISAKGLDLLMSNSQIVGCIEFKAETDGKGIFKIKSGKQEMKFTATDMENHFKSKGFENLKVLQNKADGPLRILFTYKK